MNILLLGGSNAGLHYGWAAQFQALASPRHVVVNRFLGAVGSLYGLLRLLDAPRDEAAPDLLIFEYALNDAVLMDAGWLRVDLLEDTLAEVMTLCNRRNIPLLFLCLELRPTGRARVNRAVARVKRIYARLAASRGGLPCITIEDVLGGVRREDFSDKHHLNEAASKRVAEALLSMMESRAIPVPSPSLEASGAFTYVRASAARPSGPYRRASVESTVFSGEFLELARSASSRWPGDGHIVGLMLRSTETSGDYRLAAGGHAFRKNAQSAMRDIVPNLMLLHYTKTRPVADHDLEISMPYDEAELKALPEDKSMLARPGGAPFLEQTLEIAGVMFWRGAAWPRRLLSIILAKYDAGSLFAFTKPEQPV
ncbi:MAG TPA: SGNH/GDSL hydrolase family protein [Methylocystis sp.]|nr:SGNH/GDSL hydrolase family protein [Methylocystis sp.]